MSSDKIVSHPSSDEYRAGWERIYGTKPDQIKDENNKPNQEPNRSDR